MQILNLCSRDYCTNFIDLSAHNISKYSELTKEVKYVFILTADDSSAAQENSISLDQNTDYDTEKLPTARSQIQLNSVNIISSVILNVNLHIFRPCRG